MVDVVSSHGLFCGVEADSFSRLFPEIFWPGKIPDTNRRSFVISTRWPCPISQLCLALSETVEGLRPFEIRICVLASNAEGADIVLRADG